MAEFRKRLRELPEDLWVKCPKCSEMLYRKDLDRNLKVCLRCNYHFRLSALERLALTVDKDSFQEYDGDVCSANPFDFPEYEEKIKKGQEATGLSEAAIVGEATIGGYPIVIGITDSGFMMGSMGSVVGEKVTRAIERGAQKKLPVLMISASGGGARMQEGLLSLMQMAKTAAATAKLNESLYINLLTDPSMAGVLASFASLGDIVIAEAGALIGFTGPRVIEQTLRVRLPEGFQSAEFQLEHGMVDMVLQRKDIKPTLEKILRLFNIAREEYWRRKKK